MNRIILLAACMAVVGSVFAQGNKVRPGLGNDPGVPQTQPLQLPAGVRLDGPIIGADADGGECKDKSATVGTGQGVRVCVSLCMDRPMVTGVDGTTLIDIRDGLVMISEYQEGQNGLLVERVRINMPYTPCVGGMPAQQDEREKKRRKFIVEMNLQCLNEAKSPSFDKMTYRLGGVTTDPDLLELLAILADKEIVTEAHHRVVGDAVYSITEGEGLTSEDRARLARLPQKKQSATR